MTLVNTWIDKANTALTNNANAIQQGNAFLAIPSPTQAQTNAAVVATVQQTIALTHQVNNLIKLAIGQLDNND